MLKSEILVVEHHPLFTLFDGKVFYVRKKRYRHYDNPAVGQSGDNFTHFQNLLLFNVFHYCFFTFKGFRNLIIDVIPISINRTLIVP